jgi:hypothetical protein
MEPKLMKQYMDLMDQNDLTSDVMDRFKDDSWSKDPRLKPIYEYLMDPIDEDEDDFMFDAKVETVMMLVWDLKILRALGFK